MCNSLLVRLQQVISIDLQDFVLNQGEPQNDVKHKEQNKYKMSQLSIQMSALMENEINESLPSPVTPLYELFSLRVLV